MVRKELLEDKDKARFVELLLLVGTILTALNSPPEIIYLLLLFILVSLFLFVRLLAGIKRVFWFNLNVVFLSASLSGVFTFQISVSLSESIALIGNFYLGFFLFIYGSLAYLFYITLDKPTQRGRQSMWEKLSRYPKICTIIGLIFLAIGFYFFWNSYTIYNPDNPVMWTDTLAIGFTFVSLGIALSSLCISLASGRIMQRLVNSDYENFVDLFENEKINFIKQATKTVEERLVMEVNRLMVEVLVWKSRLYFDRALNLANEISNKPQLREMSANFKHLVYLLLFQSEQFHWRQWVFNRDIGYIVKMYRRLWETEVINYADAAIRSQLLDLFVTYIGERRPNENDLTLFNRILTTISGRNPDIAFEKIVERAGQ